MQDSCQNSIFTNRRGKQLNSNFSLLAPGRSKVIFSLCKKCRRNSGWNTKKPSRDYEDYLTVGSSRAPLGMCRSLGLSFQKWLNNNETLKTRWGHLYRAKRPDAFIPIDRTYKERLGVSSFWLFYWEGSLMQSSCPWTCCMTGDDPELLTLPLSFKKL